MARKKRGRLIGALWWSLLLLLVVVLAVPPALSQEEARPPARLFITESDTSSVPVVTVRAYGLSPEGRPLDLGQEALIVKHGTQTIAGVEADEQVEVGTFTIFVVDVTPGVATHISAIQQAIEQFASTTFMREQVDAVAVYRVGATEAVQLLEPTVFYNSVRNFFASPLQPQEGATALYDSLVGLLDDVEALKPEAELVPSIVVFTDGTDAVSTAHEAADVYARAAELGIPLHTVWLENEELTVGQETGRNYLAEVAANAYGVPARLDQPETVTAIFERIAGLRSQWLLHYTIPEVASGTVPVTLALRDEPASQAQTAVSVSASAPTVALNIPPESRTLTLPALDEPVSLAFSGDVTWLDGVERTVAQAHLLVNDQVVQEIPVANLERFEAEISNLIFGDNTVSLVVRDEQGLQARSPAVTLSVVEGEREIPEPLQPAGSLLTTLAFGLLGLVLLAVFGLGGLYAYRSGRFSGFGRSRRAAAVGRDGYGEDAAMRIPTEVAAAPGGSAAYLEIMQAESPLPSRLPLGEDDTRLGRSPALADIAFEQDLTVSRLHATLIHDGHHYRIYDDGSTSGTWVNDQEVPEYGTQLFDGDDLFLGKVHLRFHQG